MVLFTCSFVFAGALDFKVQDIDGKDKRLSDFKGKTILIVNTASKCGYTPQYKSLEALYEKYKAKGFVILAFPANNFKSQEPGTNEEIKNFCSTNYKVSFPLFSKISVAGNDTHPLYKFLTTESGFNGPIAWNFTKFLVNPQGQVIARFESKVDPLSEQVVREVEKSLRVPRVSKKEMVKKEFDK